MTSTGTVRSWDFDNSFGVIDSVDTPGGCRATFSELMVEGISVADQDGCSSIGLPVGESVVFEWTQADGEEDFAFHAVAVWPSRCDPPATIPQGAFRTSLWFTNDVDGVARQRDPADLPPAPPREPFPRIVGTVREWNADEGWGVMDSSATPGGAWVHFSEIRGQSGFRVLRRGAKVEFAWERVEQDGYHFRGSDIGSVE